jgi:hypothetical protein
MLSGFCGSDDGFFSPCLWAVIIASLTTTNSVACILVLPEDKKCWLVFFFSQLHRKIQQNPLCLVYSLICEERVPCLWSSTLLCYK